MRFHIGFFIAIAVAILIWYMLFKTTWGFEFRSVGLNPNASKYAGINASLITILAMTISGAIAGLAGATEILGVNFRQTQSLSTGYGFDAIAVALLANNHPSGCDPHCDVVRIYAQRFQSNAASAPASPLISSRFYRR